MIGSTGNDLCPIAAFMAYLVIRSDTPHSFLFFQQQRPTDSISVCKSSEGCTHTSGPSS